MLAVGQGYLFGRLCMNRGFIAILAFAAGAVAAQVLPVVAASAAWIVNLAVRVADILLLGG